MRSSKRVYTGASLEAWFGKLARNWERYFEKDTLRAGQRLYTRGVIREIELSPEDAIVHMKEGGQSTYAVVQWNSGAPEIRYSREDTRAGEVLAAAGFYEIEELVSEEANPLPPEAGASAAKQAKADKAAQPERAPEPPARALAVVLDHARGTLIMQAFWKNEDGTRMATYGVAADPDPTATEREKLILLTSYAHRGGFRYESKHGQYRFADLEALPLFLSKDWPRWKGAFELEVHDAVKAVFEGVREVDVGMQAEALEDNRARVRWGVRAEGVRFNKREVSKILGASQRPVLLLGKGLFTLPEKRAGLVRKWRESVDSGLDGEVPRYMLFSLFKESGLELVLGGELAQWKQAFYDEPQAFEVPKFLRDYQGAGVRWLAHVCDRGCHGLLADEMGLGKTVQVLGLLASRPVKGLTSLIVCPASVIAVWEAEVARFFPAVRTRVLSRECPFEPSDEGTLWLASYSQLRRQKTQLAGVQFAYCVLDEAQFIKNPEAKSTQACYALKARHRIAVTGTPMENQFQDVWALFRFLMPGLLGTRQRFGREAEAQSTGFATHVRRQIAPFTLRRRKAEVLDELPEKTELSLLCPLSDMQARLYRKLANEGVLEQSKQAEGAGAGKARMHLLALLTRLRQVSCDPGLLPGVEASVEHSGKLAVLRDKLEELLAGGHKVVVFSQFAELLGRVRVHVCQQLGATVFELTGRTRKRGERVAAFQGHKGAAVMLVSLKAGGTGITLHSADYVFLLDPWWNPAAEAQAVDRVHRLGQLKRVMVYRMIARGTLEERIQELQASKKADFEAMIGQMDDVSHFSRYTERLSDLLGVAAVQDKPR